MKSWIPAFAGMSGSIYYLPPPTLAPLARRDAGGFRHRPARRLGGTPPRRHAAGRFEPHAPIFPGSADHIRQQAERAGELHLAAVQDVRSAERERAQLIVGVLAH